MNREVYATNMKSLRERYGDVATISLRKAAMFCGIDYRTLQNARDFPMIHAGKRDVVPVARLASWLSKET